MSRSVIESGTLEPLSTEEDEKEAKQSDHRVAYCRLELPCLNTFWWESFTYRYFNDQSRKEFKSWIVMHHWNEVLCAPDSKNKTKAYQDTLTAAMGKFFPWKMTRRRSNDLPWLNKGTLKKIEARKRLYWSEGRKWTPAWREEKRKTDNLTKEHKQGYIDTQKSYILSKDGNRNFFRHVKSFSRLEKTHQFDVRKEGWTRRYRKTWRITLSGSLGSSTL